MVVRNRILTLVGMVPSSTAVLEPIQSNDRQHRKRTVSNPSPSRKLRASLYAQKQSCVYLWYREYISKESVLESVLGIGSRNCGPLYGTPAVVPVIPTS